MSAGQPSGGDDYDVVIVGSGFGGTMAAHELLRAGLRVAMVERGDWVERGPHNWEQASVGTLTPYYSMETPYRALAGGERDVVGAFFCVGGPSVFYGGVSLRFRVGDFEPAPEIVTDSGAEWPVRYADLEPWYSAAERIIGVAGEPGPDPTEPPRSAPYPQLLGALSPISRRITQAARRNELHPFRLPLAFNHAGTNGRAPCAACPTCDGFACAIGAKNDLATAVLPRLLSEGLVLRPNTVAVRLVKDGHRLSALECVERRTGAPLRLVARQYILAAGSLASPHLLLASGLHEVNPAGALVGRFMTRHFNAIAMGLFPRRPDHVRQFHKQVGIHDFYFGHPSVRAPRGKLGGIQQLVTPPAELVKQSLPPGVGRIVAAGIPHMTGLLVMAEDQPQRTNGVTIDPSRRDAFGLPELQVSHRYTKRDRQAGGVLLRQAKRVLRTAGAWIIYIHEMRSFSHAVGTVRMGADPRTAPLDEMCAFRGLDNLYVADASCFPTAAGVNPSLTIAANALRVGAHVAACLGRRELAQPA